MEYCNIEEYKIPMQTMAKIKALLQNSFDAYPERTYYKQIPDFRLLAFEDDQLIGHMAVEHRIISLAGEPFRIFGLIDLCVEGKHKSLGIASNLIRMVEEMGHEYQIDFIVLFADDHRIYDNHGYELASNKCRWLMINDHQTLGVARRKLNDCLMVKQIGSRTWKEGEVDLMGTVF